MDYLEFFRQATGQWPYEYQQRLAHAEQWPSLLEAPTGSGKTEAIILAWLWRRWFAPQAVRAATPRRLAYCLPMRVLVDQTRDRVGRWLQNLERENQVGLHILMGGEQVRDWDLEPEREAILIGTQDMLISRGLNRGYALSRARWPLPYALLNNDCLWVFDEVQLMGSGLATTAQMAAFHNTLKTWGACTSLWVSATLRKDWLSTVDLRAHLDKLAIHALRDEEWTIEPLATRLNAVKTLTLATNKAGDAKKLADEIVQTHQADTLTLVVVNTVDRAAELYKALRDKLQPAAPKRGQKALAEPTSPTSPQIDLLLLHSRFRPPDRTAKIARLLRMEKSGGIVVATQVIEAGVDIDARVLFTELAPWPSLVQRFGRCNRKGGFANADVRWIDPEGKHLPYEADELKAAQTELQRMADVGPRALRDHLAQLSEDDRRKLYPAPPGSVIRKKDVLGLFDTTADLSGSDLDISGYIRETDDHDAQVLWRAFKGDPNAPLQPAAQRNELCPVPVGKLKEFQKNKKCSAYRWDFLEDKWEQTEKITPGQVYLLAAAAGGYDSEVGWNPTAPSVMPEFEAAQAQPQDANGSDAQTYAKHWQTLAGHTDDVVAELDTLLKAIGEVIPIEEQAVLRRAARWHDWGKAHNEFQTAFKKAAPPFDLSATEAWAKSASQAARYDRNGFRHELASALAMLQQGEPDLACYVVAAHHGKVRVSIRSMPQEKQPPDGRRFARGVWEGDAMPAVNLGGDVLAPAVTLSLAPMELGLSADGQPSWVERILNLLEQYGPFRLAYLEALLCAADRRASAKAGGAA